MDRAEHLAWCKQRALEYLPDDPKQAYMSFLSDMSKHEETRNHIALSLGAMLLMTGNLRGSEEVRSWIEGFN